MEGLIFGWAYLRREICVSKLNGIALYLEVNLRFLLCFTLYLRALFHLEELFNGRFFALPDWGAYSWRGLYMEGLIFGILWYDIFCLLITFSCPFLYLILRMCS